MNNKINFETGTLISPAKVTIDNVEHEVTPAVYEGNTPLSPYVLNKMQSNLSTEIYRLDVTTEIASNTEFTIPCKYKVGANVLDVYFCGEKLIKTTDTKDGHYYEIGADGDISNKLKLNGWKAEVGEGDDLEYFEFVVRGEYE